MITLVGKDFAKEGVKFIFYGPAEECESCRFKSSCIEPLEKNRMYEILAVKPNFQKCPIHDDDKVVPVDVERADIPILFDSKKVFEGSTIVYEYPDCDESCPHHDLCFAEGLLEDDKVVIVKDHGKFSKKCKKGFTLNKLEVNFVE
ncbi:UPF0179 family protein [Methanobrevibacter sp.]